MQLASPASSRYPKTIPHKIKGSHAAPSETIIDRNLVWPWFELAIVSLTVFVAVVVALLSTTRKALKSDLSTVLKGE